MNRQNALEVADAIAPLKYRPAQNVPHGLITDLPGFAGVVPLPTPKNFCMAVPCGSACCLVGWTVYALRPKVYAMIHNHPRLADALFRQARILLDLDPYQARSLFMPDGYNVTIADGATGARVLRILAGYKFNPSPYVIAGAWNTAFEEARTAAVQQDVIKHLQEQTIPSPHD